MSVEINDLGDFYLVRSSSPSIDLNVVQQMIQSVDVVQCSDKSILFDLYKAQSIESSAVSYLMEEGEILHEAGLEVTISSTESILMEFIKFRPQPIVKLFDIDSQKFLPKPDPTKKVDVNEAFDSLFESIKLGTIEVVGALIGLPTESVKTGEEMGPDWEAWAQIKIKIEQINGVLRFYSGRDTYVGLISAAFNKDFKDVDDDYAKDGAAELLNQVVGRVKVKVRELGFNMEMGLPEKLESGTKLDQKKIGFALHVNFKNSAGHFAVMAEFEGQRPGEQA